MLRRLLLPQLLSLPSCIAVPFHGDGLDHLNLCFVRVTPDFSGAGGWTIVLRRYHVQSPLRAPRGSYSGQGSYLPDFRKSVSENASYKPGKSSKYCSR